MTQPNLEQIKEFEKKTAEEENTKRHFERVRLTRELLVLTGEVAYGRSGGGSSGGGMSYHYWELNGYSKVVPVVTAEGSPQMGAMLVGFFNEVRKRKLYKPWAEQTVSREVTNAQVYVGALATTQWGVEIHGKETILEASRNPHTISYKPEGAEHLLPLDEQEASAMDEAADIIEQLKAQQSALQNGQAVRMGWIS